MAETCLLLNAATLRPPAVDVCSCYLKGSGNNIKTGSVVFVQIQACLPISDRIRVPRFHPNTHTQTLACWQTHTHAHTPPPWTLPHLGWPSLSWSSQSLFIICSSLKSSTSWGRFSSSATWDMYCWRFLAMSSKPSSFLGHLYPFLLHDRASSLPAVPPQQHTHTLQMVPCSDLLASPLPSVIILICPVISTYLTRVFSASALLQCSDFLSPSLKL